MTLAADEGSATVDESSDPVAHTRADRLITVYGFATLLAAIALAALIVRLVYVIRVRPGNEISGDGWFYHQQALGLAEGDGFVNPLRRLFGIMEPSAEHPPLYSVCLGIATKVFGTSLRAHMVASSLLGAGTVALVGMLGRRVGGGGRSGERVGLLAACLGAVYANFWVWDGLLLSESLALLLAVAFPLACLRMLDSHRRSDALVVGVLAGLGALTRAEFLLLAAVGVLVCRPWRAEQRGRRVVAAFLVAAGAAAIVLPWTAYNFGRFNKPVLVSTGAGQVMLASNCSATYSGVHLGYTEFECFALSDVRKTPDMDPSEVELVNREVAMEFIGRHWTEVPKVVGVRILRSIGWFNPFQQMDLDHHVELRGPWWVVVMATIQWQIVFPFGVAGVLLARRRGVDVVPLAAMCVLALFAVSVALGSTRYRVPLEPVAVVGTALSVQTLLDHRRRGRLDSDATVA